MVYACMHQWSQMSNSSANEVRAVFFWDRWFQYRTLFQRTCWLFSALVEVSACLEVWIFWIYLSPGLWTSCCSSNPIVALPRKLHSAPSTISRCTSQWEGPCSRVMPKHRLMIICWVIALSKWIGHSYGELVGLWNIVWTNGSVDIINKLSWLNDIKCNAGIHAISMMHMTHTQTCTLMYSIWHARWLSAMVQRGCSTKYVPPQAIVKAISKVALSSHACSMVGLMKKILTVGDWRCGKQTHINRPCKIT